MPITDCLLIVPPFAQIGWPILGTHILQACAKQAGFSVRVLYANILFAKLLGKERYRAVAEAFGPHKLGERLFTRAAFGGTPFGRHAEESLRTFSDTHNPFLTKDSLYEVETLTIDFCTNLSKQIAQQAYLAVGCSSTFEQNTAALAILKQIKIQDATHITFLGGANCEGVMAEGILSCTDWVDYIFSGESEQTFPHFLKQLSINHLPGHVIINGTPCYNMDDIPCPVFDDFFEQLNSSFPDISDKGLAWLVYESSRGCWWGAKNHCTFCGLNGSQIAFREKSPERVLADLTHLLSTYPEAHKVCMVDNIMPHSYHQTLVPELKKWDKQLYLFYELKANLTFDQVEQLLLAGIHCIQPGIEALHSGMLQLMNKGVKARQNITLLRYAAMFGLDVQWNILYGLPGDKAAMFEQTIALIPLLHHLQPPQGLYRLSVDRFSPYFNYPERYGITDMQPLPAYYDIYPGYAEVESIAYHYTASYSSEILENPLLLDVLKTAWHGWQTCWQQEEKPLLLTLPVNEHDYLLIDSRLGQNDEEALHIITAEQAYISVMGSQDASSPCYQWALDHQYAIWLDERFVPLVLTDIDTYHLFQKRDPLLNHQFSLSHS